MLREVPLNAALAPGLLLLAQVIASPVCVVLGMYCLTDSAAAVLLLLKVLEVLAWSAALKAVEQKAALRVRLLLGS